MFWCFRNTQYCVNTNNKLPCAVIVTQAWWVWKNTSNRLNLWDTWWQVSQRQQCSLFHEHPFDTTITDGALAAEVFQTKTACKAWELHLWKVTSEPSLSTSVRTERDRVVGPLVVVLLWDLDRVRFDRPKAVQRRFHHGCWGADGNRS